ncbi:MAG: hypothetical protein P1V81_01950 [Planctomycetota bacterium]|nr:hypothetical protein [Planctomycetota bacterium]
MKILTSLLLSLALLAPASIGAPAAQDAALEGPPMMLKLRDGGLLWGHITGHGPDELQFHRIDTGGRVALGWGFVDPLQERELKLGYGYIEADYEEELVQADRIPLIDGTELVGVIVGRTEDSLMVKNETAVISLPLHRIAGQAVATQVPASEIYTREERYQMKLASFGDRLAAGTKGEQAQAHYDLAGWCEGIRDFQRALMHYQLVPTIDSSWPLSELQPALERTGRKAAAQAQVDYLGEVERLTRRKNFDKALQMLAAFVSKYPDSPLMEEWNEQRDRTQKAQLKALRDQVSTRWHAAAVKMSKAAARYETYGEVMAFLEERMGQEILVAVATDLGDLKADISQEEVAVLFAEREGGRFRKASYGNGTWLLGEDKARAGIEKTEEASPQGEQDAARKALEDKIKRYIEHQSSVRSSSGSEDDMSPEDFWKSYSLNARSNWILAYYAEFSGDMRLHRAQFANCRECGGTGAREVVNLGSAREGSEGSTRLVSCPTCHHVGVIRKVSFR